MKKFSTVFLAVFTMIALFVSCAPGAKPDTDTSDDEVSSTEAVKISLKVATYNIKHCQDVNFDVGILADDIVANGIDVVGFQEVDQCTTRSNNKDQIRLLAKAAGYEYCHFSPAIKYRGGNYGTAILSRYPIVKASTDLLPSGEYEQRCAGHAVIDVNGVYVDFYNTHLSYENKDMRALQIDALAEITSKSENLVVTGDFNTADTREFTPLTSSLLIVNDEKYATFPSSSAPEIDNIFVSRGWTIENAGMGPVGHSDHRMLWVELALTP